MLFMEDLPHGDASVLSVYGHLPLCKPFCILCNGSKMLSYIRPLFRYRRTRPRCYLHTWFHSAWRLCFAGSLRINRSFQVSVLPVTHHCFMTLQSHDRIILLSPSFRVVLHHTILFLPAQYRPGYTCIFVRHRNRRDIPVTSFCH